MKLTKELINFPNILSGYRLLSFPWVLYLALSHQEKLFAGFLIFNLFTDILDGFIARRFNLQTEFGARLDSLADDGTYILAILGIFLFKSDDFAPHLLSFYTFIGVFVASVVISLMKFGKMPSLHLYSSKIGGYLQGFFFFILFAFGFHTIFYYVMITWGILSFIEHITVQLLLPEMRSNAKGLYWILKN